MSKQFNKLQEWDGKGNPTPTVVPSSIVKGIQARWFAGDDTESKGWMIEQKNGNKWEPISKITNPTDYETLALELGYDFAGEKNKNAKPEGTGPVQIGFAGPSPEMDYSQFEE